MTEDSEIFLSTSEAGKQMGGLSPKAVRDECRRGKLPCEKMKNGRYRIPQSGVNAWLRVQDEKDDNPDDSQSSQNESWIRGLLTKAGFSSPLTLVTLIGLLVGLIGFAGDALGLLSFFQGKQPGVMTGDFRIAVAEFTVLGSEATEGIGFEVADGMYQRLTGELDQFELGVFVNIWGPEEVIKAGSVNGDTPLERAISAQELAQELNANILVYGVIDATAANWTVQPEFYISEDNFYDAQEITGHHEIGDSFLVRASGETGKRIAISDEIAPRVNFLSKIAVGLIFYTIENYEKSLEILRDAENLEWIEQSEGFEQESVRQVLYLFIANAAGKSNKIDIAELYNKKSLEIDPEYARAHIGLASVMYIRAISNSPIDADLLKESVQQYLRALDAQNQPEFADISTKGHFGLGQSLMVLHLIGEEDSFNSAITEFENVIADYEDGVNPRVQALAGEAHGRLGRIYTELEITEQAITEFELAAELLKTISDRSELFEKRATELRGETNNQ